MPPKKRRKGQLTLLDFPKIANPLTAPTSSSRPQAPDPHQSRQQKTLKLPHASVPSIFKSTPATPRRCSFSSSAADEAWEIGERVLNGINLNSRFSYEEDGKEIPDDNSDADFEQDEVVHHVARQRPSLNRKHATYGLRDDRASMTKRSGNRKARKRTPIKIATQVSMRLLNDANVEDSPDHVRRREVIDQHEVVIVEGEKSEMSGTDNEDENISNDICISRPSESKQRVSHADSALTPTNRRKMVSQGKESPYKTPKEFSLHLKRPHIDFGSAKAPRKAKSKPKDNISRSPPRRYELSRLNISGKHETGEQTTDSSVFETGGIESPIPTPSTRKLVRRLHVSDSESSGAGDFQDLNEEEVRGGCDQQLDKNQCHEGAMVTEETRQRSPVQHFGEGIEQKPISSEDEDEHLAALARRKKGTVWKSLTLPENPAIGSIQNDKNRAQNSGNGRVCELAEPLRTRVSTPGGCSLGMRRSVFDSAEFVPTPSALEGVRESRSRSIIRAAGPKVVSDGHRKINADGYAKKVLRLGTSNNIAKCSVRRNLQEETGCPCERNLDTPSKRNYSSLDKVSDDVEVLDRDSESGKDKPGLIDFGSVSEGEDGSQCEGDESVEERDENDQSEGSRMVTRSASREARRSTSEREPSPAFDFGDISDSSSDLPDDGSVQEVLPQESVKNSGIPKYEARTPERPRRVKSLFLNSGRKRVSITPESSPSPPSSKKRFRLSKLATRDSEEEENVDLMTQSLKTHPPVRIPVFERDAQVRERRKGDWYHERDITNFSSSSSLVVRENAIIERRRSSRTLARRRRGGLRVRNSPPIRKLVLESDSSDVKEGKGMNPEDVPAEQNPLTLSLKDSEAVRLKTDHGVIGGAHNVVIDLIDDMEVDTAENDSRDFGGRRDDIRNSSSGGNSRESEAEDVIAVDDDDKPPPFNLVILCKPGESVKEMLHRVGEETVMEKVTEAQDEGREVLGGEELGLTQSFNQGVFNRFSKTVVADQIGQRRKVKNVTEQALRGEYQFNYRGKGSDSGGRRGEGSWYRGRGRRNTTKGGSAKDSSKVMTGRLANVRRRRS